MSVIRMGFWEMVSLGLSLPSLFSVCIFLVKGFVYRLNPGEAAYLLASINTIMIAALFARGNGWTWKLWREALRRKKPAEEAQQTS